MALSFRSLASTINNDSTNVKMIYSRLCISKHCVFIQISISIAIPWLHFAIFQLKYLWLVRWKEEKEKKEKEAQEAEQASNPKGSNEVAGDDKTRKTRKKRIIKREESILR